jgi:hypothetical protein
MTLNVHKCLLLLSVPSVLPGYVLEVSDFNTKQYKNSTHALSALFCEREMLQVQPQFVVAKCSKLKFRIAVYFLKVKQVYAVRKWKKYKRICYILINDFMFIPEELLKLDTALPHSLHSRCFSVPPFSVKRDLLAVTSTWRLAF